MIDVCICTHRADKKILARVLTALSEQTLPRRDYQIFIIDNANEPPLHLEDFPNVTKIVREPKLGVAHARVRAFSESTADAVVFVDDDNVLAHDFLENAARILKDHPEVGCFSGKILIPASLAVPAWIIPLLGSLAVRDLGEVAVIDWFRGDWAPWVPAATASMVLRRAVADTFLRIHATRREFSDFGRKGRYNLMSGEDFLIALSAADAGFKCAYFPKLVMSHYIRPERLTVQHMARLMLSLGVTDIKRDRYLEKKPTPFSHSELRYRLLALDFKDKDVRARFCMWLYQMVYVPGTAYRLLKTGQTIRAKKDVHASR